MRSTLLVALLVAALATWSCGGSSSGGGSSGNPSTPTPTGTTTTINILGQRGAQSYSPNPAVAGQGDLVAWRNSDNVTHHIVLNDGSLDIGDITPGATSPSMRLSVNGANYHCTIHPTTMNGGSITVAAGTPPPPCQGPYCP
jgi:plastocyanin